MIENNLAIMKFVSKHKFLFGCLLTAWIIVLLVNRTTHSQLKVQRLSHPLIHPLQHNRLPPTFSFKMVKALRYCNPPNDITAGQEGKAPTNGSLEFVALMIRHGDRAPLHPIRNLSIINCGTQNSKLLESYLKTMANLRRFTKHLDLFQKFPLKPAEKMCTPPHMTLVGAHQHLMLGYALKKIYIDHHNLFGMNWSYEQIQLHSTVVARTYQSALAFLYGFLPSFNISSIRIHPSNDERFCMTDYYCNCPLATKLENLMFQKKKRLLYSHPAVLHLLQRLSPIVKAKPRFSDILDPFVMFDSLMGYVCHGSHLPCIPGTNECVTFEHVRNLIAYIDWIGRQFVRDSSNTKAALLNMQGFLIHLLGNIKNLMEGKDQTRFVLYSAHDISLDPLLTALGIDDGIIIPYASRIAFEVYSYTNLNENLQYAVKVLYNGKDVTKYATFCRQFFKDALKRTLAFGYGVCPFESFRKFVEELVLSVGTSSFQAACDVVPPSYPFDTKISSYADDSDKP